LPITKKDEHDNGRTPLPPPGDEEEVEASTEEVVGDPA
jgi:hypothetical protein